MPIERSSARSLVARFSGKQGYPWTKEGRKALIDAFQNAPENAKQAADVADDLQVDTKYCPDVSEVWRAARALKSEKRIGCEKCNHTGWKMVRPGSYPCGCSVSRHGVIPNCWECGGTGWIKNEAHEAVERCECRRAT